MGSGSGTLPQQPRQTCILPLSALTLQHGGTSCVIPLTGGEFQDPTRGTHPGRVPNPSFILILGWKSPYLWPFLRPPNFFQHVPHNAESEGLSNQGDSNNKDTSTYSREDLLIIFHVNPIMRSSSMAFRYHPPRPQLFNPYSHSMTLPFLNQADPDHLSNYFTIL